MRANRPGGHIKSGRWQGGDSAVAGLSRLDVTAKQVWPIRRGGEGQQAGRTSAVRANRPGGHIKSGRWQGGDSAVAGQVEEKEEKSRLYTFICCER